MGNYAMVPDLLRGFHFHFHQLCFGEVRQPPDTIVRPVTKDNRSWFTQKKCICILASKFSILRRNK